MGRRNPKGAEGPKTEEDAAGGVWPWDRALPWAREGPGRRLVLPQELHVGPVAVGGTEGTGGLPSGDVLSDLWTLLSFTQGAPAELQQ